MQRFIPLFAMILLTACSTTPDVDYKGGCGARILTWTFGPKKDVRYLEVCYADLVTGDLLKHFELTPNRSINKSTGQPVDRNGDGISDHGTGRLLRDRIRWWGDNCQNFVRTIVQKGCMHLGNNSNTEGCDWVSIQIRPKPGIKQGYVSLTPFWYVRLANGKETYLPAKTLTTGFSNCR
ncbi:MAG: hypothetical protein GY862_34090 [Gammaproteobacteria bacterium]|nr:hypothetical protein [Gammaproteobacteria bacterium]